jgi:superfamily II DNA or RNA helicase
MTTTVDDRDYQVSASDGAFARWEGGDEAALLILPTGTGETVVAGMLTRRA